MGWYLKYMNAFVYGNLRTYENEEQLETTWNHLKPPETTQKLPKTTWNHLKPAIL